MPRASSSPAARLGRREHLALTSQACTRSEMFVPAPSSALRQRSGKDRSSYPISTGIWPRRIPLRAEPRSKRTWVALPTTPEVFQDRRSPSKRPDKSVHQQTIATPWGRSLVEAALDNDSLDVKNCPGKSHPKIDRFEGLSVHDAPSQDGPLHRGIAQIDAIQDQLKMRDCSVRAHDLLQEGEQGRVVGDEISSAVGAS